MNKKRIRQMDLALRRRLADRPAADCFAGHDDLLRRIETEGYMQRFAPLFNTTAVQVMIAFNVLDKDEHGRFLREVALKPYRG